MSDRRGGGGPPRKPFDGRGERAGGPPRGGRDQGGPPRRGRPGIGESAGPGRPRDESPRGGSRFRDDRPPARDRYRDDAPPPREGYRDSRPPARERYRDEAPPPRGAPREEGFERRERFEDGPPPWQRERPERPPARQSIRGDVAGPVMVPPTSYRPEQLAKAAEKVAAACLEVHRQLGNGLDATTYHRALALELQARAIPYEREARVPIAYKERQIDTRKVDFVVEGCIVEILSQREVAETEVDRHTNYLKASGYGIAVLVNFGPSKVEIRNLVG